MVQTLDDASVAATLDALIAYDPRAVYRALSLRREALRRRFTIECRGCGVVIQQAHDRQRFCSEPCKRHARYLRVQERRDERRQALAGYMYPLPEPPLSRPTRRPRA
jgi:hypothetical protein